MITMLIVTTTNLLSKYSVSGVVLGTLNVFSHGLLPSTLANRFFLLVG